MTALNTSLGQLKQRSEFLFVRAGEYRAQGALVIQMRKNPTHSDIKVGFTATKKIGNAVIRNRAKRRMRHIAREVLPVYGIAGHDYVFIARNGAVKRPFALLLEDAKTALTRLSPTNKRSAANKGDR